MTPDHQSGHDIPSAMCARSVSAWLPWVVLAMIVLASTVLRARELNHPGIKDLDEVYHAIVARNLIADPLRPQLITTPYLDYDFRNWQGNHVWLHKPPVALWQMALSMAIFGDAPWAVRLPSLLMAGGTVVLTFLLGRQLSCAVAGLFAAAFVAFNPAITLLVQGRVFSDHVDVAMLFYCELAVLLLVRAIRTRKQTDAALAGLTQGIAWMTKSYPAMFLTCVALVVLVAFLNRSGTERPKSGGLSIKQFCVLVVATLVCIAPWTIWCLAQFPREFLYEQGHVFQHLYSDVEQFAAPWDRLLADYLLRGLLEWYPLGMIAVLVMLWDGRTDRRRLLVGAWALIVLIPHLLATSKTPTATLIGWPAAWLAIGIMIADASRGRIFAMAALTIGAVLVLFWPQRPGPSVMGSGEGYVFGKIALDHWPLFTSAGIVLAFALIAARFGSPRPVQSFAPRFAVFALVVIAIVPYVRVGVLSSQRRDETVVAFKRLGERVRRQAPSNAVFLVDVQTRGEWSIAMWWLDRTCYPLNRVSLESDVQQIVSRGGVPMVLSRRDWPTPVVLSVPGEGTIYKVR